MGGNPAPCRLFFRVLILARPCNPPAGVETRSAKQDLFRHSQAREDRVKATSLVLCAFLCVPAMLLGQGVTTGAMSGTVSDQDGAPLPEANVVAVHVPSSTAYRAVARAGGAYNIPNMRVGGPYRDRKSTRLNSSHGYISYAVFCLKKKKGRSTHVGIPA